MSALSSECLAYEEKVIYTAELDELRSGRWIGENIM